MAMDNDDILLGLNVFGKKLRMVEAKKWDGETQLQNVVEADLEVPFDFYAVGNRDLIPKFADEINNLINGAPEALDTLNEIAATLHEFIDCITVIAFGVEPTIHDSKKRFDFNQHSISCSTIKIRLFF